MPELQPIQASLEPPLKSLLGCLACLGWLLIIFLWGPPGSAYASEIVGARPSHGLSVPSVNTISKLSQYCGIKFLKKYLPETLKKHTLCGAAVAEMVECMSEILRPGMKCNAKCGDGKMFVGQACEVKMKNCGYKRVYKGSVECHGPGAVTAFTHSPTPRGQLFGHVQFGCGGGVGDPRYCSSYRRPIEHSWPPGQPPDQCFVPNLSLLSESSLAQLSIPETPILPTLPEFDFNDSKHQLPPSESCSTCGSYAEKLKYYREQKQAFEALVAANKVAQALEAASITYRDTPDIKKEDEMRSAIISATAIQLDDFEAAAIHHLLSFCAQDRARFYGVFWQMPEADQIYISANMTQLKLAKRERGIHSTCEVPAVIPLMK